MDLTCLLTLSVSYSSLLWSAGKGLVVKTTLVHTTIDFLFYLYSKHETIFFHEAGLSIGKG